MEAATGALNVRWISTGTRYMLGHTQDEPHFYGIWNRDSGAEPTARFPFTEHGKAEAVAAFLAVEPAAAELTLDGTIAPSTTPGVRAPSVEAQQTQPGSVDQPSSGAAVISLVLGILGMMFPLILSAPAIVFGCIGINSANRRGAPGKGIAIAGLVLGLIGTLLGLGILGKLGGIT